MKFGSIADGTHVEIRNLRFDNKLGLSKLQIEILKNADPNRDFYLKSEKAMKMPHALVENRNRRWYLNLKGKAYWEYYMPNPSEVTRQVEEMKERTADQCIDAVFEELGGRSGLDIRENTNYDDEIEAEIKMALKIRFKKIFG